MSATNPISSPLSPLIELCHFRWAIPVLSELQVSGGEKFVTLKNRLAVSPDALRRSLNSLIAAGLVRANTGYGHPMRPEYVITEKGRSCGRSSANLYRELRRLNVEQVCLNKWSMPALVGVEVGNNRFNDIKRLLPGATPRALTVSLKNLARERLLVRRVIDEYPPAVSYQASQRGSRIALLAARLSDAH